MKRRRFNQTTSMYYGAPSQPAQEPPPTVVQPDARPYLHTVEAGALLPLIQSLIWGALAGLGALVLSVTGRQSFRGSLLWTCGAFVVVTGLAWMAYQRHWFSISSLEKLMGVDIDGDGVIGSQAVTPEVTIRLQDTQDGAYQETRISLPATMEQLRTLAAGVLSGVPLAEGHWIGQSRGQPFSKAQFYALRAEMIRRGLVEYINPTAPAQGYQLTRAGMAVMRYLSPTLETKDKL
jgi:hypothetical protein